MCNDQLRLVRSLISGGNNYRGGRSIQGSYLDSIDPEFVCSQDSGNRRLLVAVKEDDVTTRGASYEEPTSGGETAGGDTVGRREVCG